MAYVITAACVPQLKALSPRPDQNTVLRVVRRVIFGVLLVACYVGAFFAVLMIEALPLTIMDDWWKLDPRSPVHFWVGVLLALSLVILCCFVAIASYRRFRGQEIDIDLIAILLGSIVAVWYVGLSLPPRQ